MGTTDKLIRATIAGIIAILYFSNIINGALAFVLASFGIILFITSFIGFCPLYSIIRHSTRKKTS